MDLVSKRKHARANMQRGALWRKITSSGPAMSLNNIFEAKIENPIFARCNVNAQSAQGLQLKEKIINNNIKIPADPLHLLLARNQQGINTISATFVPTFATWAAEAQNNGIQIIESVFCGNSYVFKITIGGTNFILKVSKEEYSCINHETKTEHESNMYSVLQKTAGYQHVFFYMVACGALFAHTNESTVLRYDIVILQALSVKTVMDIDYEKEMPIYIHWVAKAFEKLLELHRLNFVHGDCKLNNITFTQNFKEGELLFIDPERLTDISTFKKFTQNVLRLADITELLFVNNCFLKLNDIKEWAKTNLAALRANLINQKNPWGKYIIWSVDFALFQGYKSDIDCSNVCKQHIAHQLFPAERYTTFSELEREICALNVDNFLEYLKDETNLGNFWRDFVNAIRKPVQTVPNVVLVPNHQQNQVLYVPPMPRPAPAAPAHPYAYPAPRYAHVRDQHGNIHLVQVS